MPGDRNPVKHQLKIYGPAALAVIVAFAIAFQFIKPAPPDRVVMATGGWEPGRIAAGWRRSVREIATAGGR